LTAVLLFRCVADCAEVTEDLVSATNVTSTIAAAYTTAAAAVAADDDNNNKDAASHELLRLHISPEPNAAGELFRALGSSVVFTCQRIVAADAEADEQSAAEATTIDWFDKNDMIIPAQTG